MVEQIQPHSPTGSTHGRRRFMVAGAITSAIAATAFGLGWMPGQANSDTGPSAAKVEPHAVATANVLSEAFRNATKQVLPAVVAIETRARVAKNETPSNNRPTAENGDPFQGTPFGDMFKNDPQLRELFRNAPNTRRFGGNGNMMPPGGAERGLGSGVIIDKAGFILTNNHVVGGGGEVIVRLSDGREYPAVEVKTDPKTDLAIVKIDAPDDLVAAKMGDSDVMEIGDWVLALGQPFGLESTVTAGIISAKQRGVGIVARESFLQTDAAINPGNSGGPLVNLNGEIVGINTAISSRSGGNEGIGFAVPINLAKWIAGELRENGSVRRAYLGIGIQPINSQLAQQFNVKPRAGVLVTMVQEGTPAAKAGLKTGDIIASINGVKVQNPQELQMAVERCKVGETHKIGLIREGAEVSIKFTPESQPANYGAREGDNAEEPSAPAKAPTKLGEMGLSIEPLSADVAKQLKLDDASGVVITEVQPGSPAAEAGLSAGDVIAQVNRVDVKTVDEVKAAIDKAKLADGVLLLVRSGEGTRFVVVK